MTSTDTKVTFSILNPFFVRIERKGLRSHVERAGYRTVLIRRAEAMIKMRIDSVQRTISILFTL